MIEPDKNENEKSTQEIQQSRASETIESIFATHGFQKEVMADELLRVRKQSADEYTKEMAEKEVYDFLETDIALQDAARRLEEQRRSPLVSRETQLATLKGMVRDYEKGVRRPGLSAHSVLKAMELINRMTGYEAPQEIKVEHEHKINVLPIIGETFKGELEPLEIIDLGDATIVNTGDHAKPPAKPPPPAPAPPKQIESSTDDFPEPEQEDIEVSLEPKDLFP